MDFVFKCPHCEQALEVDSSGVGSDIVCPACDHVITVPPPPPASIRPTPGYQTTTIQRDKPLTLASSGKAGESLIQKPNKTLETTAKQGDKKFRVKTIRHSDCLAGGKDSFDETVSHFLAELTEQQVVSVSPISYSVAPSGGGAPASDYGVLIVFKG